MSDQDRRARLIRALEYRQIFDDRLDRIERQVPFDSVHDVDTSESVELWELPQGDQLQVGRDARYSPTPVRTVRHVLGQCDVKHEDMTFVDVGCGKGRVLLQATEFPFRRIVGVEASETLCDIARANVEKASATLDGCDRIDVVHADATRFDVPDDAGLFYFYEPFSTEVSSAVLERIEDSVRRHPRPVVLCFTGRGQPDGQAGEHDTPPVAAAAAEIRPRWKRIGTVSSPDAVFYDSLLYAYEDHGSFEAQAVPDS
ncbi:class I SAM-dependent methyltransferase [Streptomyces sp. Tue 6075]|uniref:class I SAM-dependent methyltransferase n=1 Tax=Streptomyces sp. Tue 6075 TaxID=1661694 RepID=UPI00094B6E6E|nr:class I SAM-dependent methyltransferase [Streptomyces sp. Tue 6075]